MSDYLIKREGDVYYVYAESPAYCRDRPMIWTTELNQIIKRLGMWTGFVSYVYMDAEYSISSESDWALMKLRLL